jgi:hypothetical protein
METEWRPEGFEAHQADLLGVDTGPRRSRPLNEHEADFTDKEDGYTVGKDQAVSKCEKCGRRGVEQRRSKSTFWLHRVRFWVDSTGKTRSKPIDRCQMVRR